MCTQRQSAGGVAGSPAGPLSNSSKAIRFPPNAAARLGPQHRWS